MRSNPIDYFLLHYNPGINIIFYPENKSELSPCKKYSLYPIDLSVCFRDNKAFIRICNCETRVKS
ncbi:MAG: hypothetical protein BWK80_37715 [Desulfobacteraceae bacterium IS3]|nr:MAG: hypothetical protein BWK80_37715 [Desulfobacteraceae bacterium IS3]